jgi:hypothetical protein
MPLVSKKPGKHNLGWNPSAALTKVLPTGDRVFVDDGSSEAEATARDARGLSAAVKKSAEHVLAANTTEQYLVVVFSTAELCKTFKTSYGIEAKHQTIDGDELLKVLRSRPPQ